MKTKPPKGFTSREESLQHVADIALAAKAGKEIQLYSQAECKWEETRCFSKLTLTPDLFRIKPEPEEIYVTYHSDRARTVSDTPLPAANCLDDKPVVKKFREVIE